MRCFISTETIGPCRVPTRKLPSYGSYASFSDPDGNRWVLQQVKTRLPGRGLSLDVATLTELFQETEKTPRHVRADRSETPLVRLVCGLRGCARARKDSRRSSQRCNAPHRRCSCRTCVRVSMRSDIVPGAVFPDYELRPAPTQTTDGTAVSSSASVQLCRPGEPSIGMIPRIIGGLDSTGCSDHRTSFAENSGATC